MGGAGRGRTEGCAKDDDGDVGPEKMIGPDDGQDGQKGGKVVRTDDDET